MQRSDGVHSTKYGAEKLAPRHGYKAAQFEGAFARFLPPEPNIRTLKRGAAKRSESVRMRVLRDNLGANQTNAFSFCLLFR